ncbi:SacI homology domain-containing protein [Geopyxis carbonaria]|nr:SacI homology domain-containing protein [Geopyxis carbonaria]
MSSLAPPTPTSTDHAILTPSGATTPIPSSTAERLAHATDRLGLHDPKLEVSPIPDEKITPPPVTPHIVTPPLISPPLVSPPLVTVGSQPVFPQLANNPPASPGARDAGDGKDEEPSMAKSFDRTRAAPAADAEDEPFRCMHRFTLYETTSRYYIVGSDINDRTFRILKLDRTAEPGELSITEDEVMYTHGEMKRLLATIEDGNIATGGLKQKCPFWGLLGFIRFTGVYYMLLVTKRSIVAMVGGHYVYQIDKTELVPLTTEAARKPERNSEEARFVGILGNLDLTRSFYFSYSYDITRTLQHNIIRQRETLAKGLLKKHEYNDMFTWNHYLLEPAKACIRNVYDWCMPIVHGYVDQASISVYGRSIYITLFARRSRYFAGARFLKRGANDLGYVANDVETEQIVSEMLTTSFHAPGKRLFANPNYTSYVQHRGSIPLFWTQKNDAATPKPPVEMNLVDPFFSAAALHFDDLFGRYGAPVIVLNLVKSRERTPRESLLLKEFTQAITYLNQFLPKDKNIHYIAWDMSRAAKSRDQDVIETLETIAENVVSKTGFFHNGSSDDIRQPRLQNGVCRTNCIDCLDRTNAAQFVIGKRALGHQLHALGVISGTSIEYDTDAVDLFTHMYHDHGDTIAVQYAGSHLVNTMETYRKINQWTSHPRDMLESFKRYYNNSFLDGQRQEAYNLFLGNYIFAQGQPMLWDLSTDYYLHHADPRLGLKRRSYTKWWTPANLKPRTLPPVPTLSAPILSKPYHHFDDYWLGYYRPRALSSFFKVFALQLNSTIRYIPVGMTLDGSYDLSPFVVRTHAAATADTGSLREKPASKKKLKPRRGIIEFPGFKEKPEQQADSLRAQSTLAGWPPAPPPAASTRRTPGLHPRAPSHISQPGLIDDISAALRSTSSHLLDPSLAPVNMATAVERSLHPSITDVERRELFSPLPTNLPLVVSASPARDADVEDAFTRHVEMQSREPADADVALYRAVVDVPENPLRVEPEDAVKKRYLAYGQWVLTGRLKRQGPAPGVVVR